MHQDNFGEAVGMAKNYATKEARVEIDFDTNKWSGRMKNIVCKAIDTGVANCGWETAWWVEHFLKHHGLDTLNHGGYWNRDLPLKLIKPNKIEEAVAYVAAIAKMNPDEGGYGGNNYWLERLSDKGISKLSREEITKQGLWRTEGITDIPIPRNFDTKDKEKFLRDYLKPIDEQQAIKRAELINLVRSGSLLSISYIIK
mgnify:CR=1 FL=1|tara:strand:+ start:135 stop:731 length:597 start_codon:yes stop_codon:yes gene_type:complete